MLQRLIAWFLPREDHFYAYLERHADCARRAAAVLALHRSGGQATEIRSSIEALEAEADDIGTEMLEALARTFITPIDREDLQRLSKKLDDIVDYLDLAARACVLYGVERPTPAMLVQIDKIEAATRLLAETLPLLRQRRYQDLIDAAHKVIAIEKEGDVVFRDALSRLFHDDAVDAKTILREKEVLEDLELAIDRCEQVAETLINVAVKHA